MGEWIEQRVKRSSVRKLKESFGMNDESDEEFLEWWRRNRGTGYKLEIVG